MTYASAPGCEHFDTPVKSTGKDFVILNKPKISNRKSQALFIADRLRISSVLVIHQNRELLDRG